MSAKLSKLVLIGLFSAILAAAAFSDIYFVRDDSGGSIFSKGDEAYLFLGSGHTGYHFRLITYPFARLGEYFYAPPFPKNNSVSMIVMHITASGIERYSMNFGRDTGGAPQFLTPLKNEFYAMCPGAVLCKLTETGFQPATEEEQQQFGGIEHLDRRALSNINGWSFKEIGHSPGQHFEVSIDGKFTISVRNRAAGPREYPNVEVSLLRPGRPPEELYNVDGAPHRVSAAEYKRDFPPGTALKDE